VQGPQVAFADFPNFPPVEAPISGKRQVHQSSDPVPPQDVINGSAYILAVNGYIMNGHRGRLEVKGNQLFQDFLGFLL
jgi:hypothetical protein